MSSIRCQSIDSLIRAMYGVCVTFEELLSEEVHQGLIRLAHWLAQQSPPRPNPGDVQLFDDGPILPD